MEEMSKWMEGEKVESSKRNGRKEKMYKIGRKKKREINEWKEKREKH